MTALLGRFDSALGKVATYRLVLWSLVALTAVALLGSLVGLISYPLGDLLPTLVVAVAASWIGSKIMGAIARTPTYGTSAVITGLLLFFLFFPSHDLIDLVAVAAGAVVAAASKYLLAIGGRHVLNPAATGLFVAGVAGIGASAWWVATPFLLPFVLVAAILILVRVRLVLPAVVFVVLAAVLVAVGQAVHGTGQNPLYPLLSTPILFMVVFMLSEPFTLPPRTWQRILELAVVAVVFAVPYLITTPLHLGTLGPSPELAILIGNVLSLLLARPVSARLRFAGRRPLTETSTEFAFTPERPINHLAGQYLELQVPHRGVDRRGTRRMLTIVSAPDDPSGEVKVAVRTSERASSFKRALDAMPVGSPLRATTVGGAFTLPRNRSTPLLLVAGGIGITPFISQLQNETALVAGGATPRDILLVDRISSADELPYADVLAASGVRVLLVSPDPAALRDVDLPDHWHLVDRFDAGTLGNVLPEPARRVAYVSGSPRFVARARGVLRSAGVRRIRTDAFSGY